MSDLAIAENTNISLPVEEDLALLWTHIGNKQEQGAQPKAIHRLAHEPTIAQSQHRIAKRSQPVARFQRLFDTRAADNSSVKFVRNVCFLRTDATDGQRVSY
jgi:hypothetical protein